MKLSLKMNSSNEEHSKHCHQLWFIATNRPEPNKSLPPIHSQHLNSSTPTRLQLTHFPHMLTHTPPCTPVHTPDLPNTCGPPTQASPVVHVQFWFIPQLVLRMIHTAPLVPHRCILSTLDSFFAHTSSPHRIHTSLIGISSVPICALCPSHIDWSSVHATCPHTINHLHKHLVPIGFVL